MQAVQAPEVITSIRKWGVSNVHGILYACEQNCYPRLVYCYAAIYIDHAADVNQA